MPSSFRKEISLFSKKNLSPEANRQRLVKTAVKTLNKLIESGRASRVYTTRVDDTLNKPVESAQRVVLYTFIYLREAAMFTLGFLQNRAYPGGAFSKAYWLSVDGEFFPAGSFNPLTDITIDAKEVIIGNMMPYARRIDIQMVGSHKLSYTTQAGLYDDAARATTRRFGNSVVARRLYDYSFPNKYRPVHPTKFQSPVVLLKMR